MIAIRGTETSSGVGKISRKGKVSLMARLEPDGFIKYYQMFETSQDEVINLLW